MAQASKFSVSAIFKAVDRVTAPVTRMQSRVTRFARSAQRGLRSVRRAMRGVTRGLSAGIGKIARYGSVIAGVAAYATIRAINNLADAADNLAKRSRRLEFPIEALQEWQFVAEQSGMTTEGFDKSIEKFVKTVGEAKAGTGTLITILRKSNPELLKQVTSAGSASEAFDIYMKALQGTEDVMERTALATAAFGRSGAKMLNITEQSAEAIAKLRNEQRENGILTAEQAKRAEEYNDSINSLKKSFTGLLQGVFFPMFPALTKLTRGWREWIVQNKALISSRVIEFAKDLRDKLGELFERLKKFNETNNIFDMLAQGLSKFIDVIEFLGRNAKTIAIIVGAIYALSTALAVLNAVAIVASTPFIGIGLAIAGAAAAGVALVIWIDDIVAMFDKMPAVIKTAFFPLYAVLKTIQFLKSGKVGEILADTGAAVVNFIKGGQEKNANRGRPGYDDGGNPKRDLIQEALDRNKTRRSAALDKAATVAPTVVANLTPSVNVAGYDNSAPVSAVTSEGAPRQSAPQVTSPAERAAKVNREETVNKSTVDVNLNNVPQGSEVKQSGAAPGFQLKTAYSGV